jgi:gliding motility-associated protein GldM
MNVFYIGVDNPVDVSVAGVPPEKVSVSITGGGSINKVNGSTYNVRVKTPGKVTVTAIADLDGKKVNMGTKEFRVKTVPDPIAVVGNDPKNMKGGVIQANILLAAGGVKAILENFDFDLSFKVTEFAVSATIKGYDQTYSSNGAAFTPQQQQLIKQVGSGKKVYIEDVKAQGPDGSVRKLGSISYKLQ